jgi:hypothetical protein
MRSARRRSSGPSKHLLIYGTYATELLDGRDTEMMRYHLGNIDANLEH